MLPGNPGSSVCVAVVKNKPFRPIKTLYPPWQSSQGDGRVSALLQQRIWMMSVAM